jgi:NADH:ubiquinone oxidoreductase subunit F (NADH-binding)
MTPDVAIEHLLAGTATGRPLGRQEHERVHGALPHPAARDLVEELAHAGLTGRGGAGFPTARKIASVAAKSGAKAIVANVAETEPMSQKDRVLIHLATHLVLDGLELVADAIGAKTRVVAVSSNPDKLSRALEAAIAERGDRRVRIAPLPPHYLAGQETALLNALDGGALKPRLVPPFPAESGLGRRPTLIQNAETFAHVALIARHGAEWFRAAGTESSPGTILVTLGGAVERPGVYEVRGGSSVRDVLALAGGVTDSLRGVLIGGYFGTWLGPEVLDMHLDATRLARHGATLGTGVIVALDDRHCPTAETARVAAWMASMSAGQCGPCANGLPAIARELASIANGRANRNSYHLVQRWGGLVQRRGACHHPDGTARFVLSALELFHDNFRWHERNGPCDRCYATPALRVPVYNAAVAA